MFLPLGRSRYRGPGNVLLYRRPSASISTRATSHR